MSEVMMLVQSILIGASCAGPVGMVGMMCIRQTTRHGRSAGLSVGMGSAVVDAVVVMFVTTFVLFDHPWFIEYHQDVRIAGGIILIIVGLHSLYMLRRYRLHSRAADNPSVLRGRIRSGWISGALYTLANPLTYISYITLAATVMVSKQESFSSWIIQGCGILIGAFAWWFIVTMMTHRGTKKYGDRFVKRLNLISAIIVVATGIGVVLVA